jgi:hypothetical protein
MIERRQAAQCLVGNAGIGTILILGSARRVGLVLLVAIAAIEMRFMAKSPLYCPWRRTTTR